MEIRNAPYILSTLSNGNKKEDKPYPNARTRTLTLETLSPSIRALQTMDFAIRGPVITRAYQIAAEMATGVQKPFTELIKANIGDAHAMGQTPITYIRQVIALISCPHLVNHPGFPPDVRNKAVNILKNCSGSSAGSYTEPRGMLLIRQHISKYIQQRDLGIPANPEDIMLTNGASDAIRVRKACLKLFRAGHGEKRSGILTPVPQFPLYAASIAEFDMHSVEYFLDESKGWSTEVSELQRAITDARKSCNPRAIVIINPGNPTGNVLSRENIMEIIKFAYREKLFIFADEVQSGTPFLTLRTSYFLSLLVCHRCPCKAMKVYQDNVYGTAAFFSFKRVMMEMGPPYNTMELVSFFSASKGYAGECGLRGGYCELVNMDPDVKQMLLTSIVAKLCPNIVGQAAVDCLADPPKPGDSSFHLFLEEKSKVLTDLERKAEVIHKKLSEIPGISCQKIRGSMYAFPRIDIPTKAIQTAEEKGLQADVHYALKLLESTGISIVPGTAVGQQPGTYHFRTTLLPPMAKLEEMMIKLQQFHTAFLQKYT